MHRVTDFHQVGEHRLLRAFSQHLRRLDDRLRLLTQRRVLFSQNTEHSAQKLVVVVVARRPVPRCPTPRVRAIAPFVRVSIGRIIDTVLSLDRLLLLTALLLLFRSKLGVQIHVPRIFPVVVQRQRLILFLLLLLLPELTVPGIERHVIHPLRRRVHRRFIVRQIERHLLLGFFLFERRVKIDPIVLDRRAFVVRHVDRTRRARPARRFLSPAPASSSRGRVDRRAAACDDAHDQGLQRVSVETPGRRRRRRFDSIRSSDFSIADRCARIDAPRI